MKVRKLKFKKEIVANLSNTESNQIRGGKSGILSCLESACGGSCFFLCTDTQDFGTLCCVGGTYADCTFSNHCK